MSCVQFFVVLVVSVLLHVCNRTSLNFSDYLFLSVVGVRWIVGVLNSVVNIFFLSPVPRILWLACNFLLFWWCQCSAMHVVSFVVVELDLRLVPHSFFQQFRIMCRCPFFLIKNGCNGLHSSAWFLIVSCGILKNRVLSAYFSFRR